MLGRSATGQFFECRIIAVWYCLFGKPHATLSASAIFAATIDCIRRGGVIGVWGSRIGFQVDVGSSRVYSPQPQLHRYYSYLHIVLPSMCIYVCPRLLPTCGSIVELLHVHHCHGGSSVVRFEKRIPTLTQSLNHFYGSGACFPSPDYLRGR